MKPVSQIFASDTAVNVAATPAPTSVTSIAFLQRMRVVSRAIVPRIEYALTRLDYRVHAGMALAACMLIALVAINLPQHRAVVELRQQLTTARVSAAPPANAPTATLLATLPAREKLPQILGQVYQQAAAAGVSLERGNYQLTLERAGNIARYQFSFPLTATYPRIRDFVDKVLLAVPAAAIESVRLERKTIGDENVNAELNFALFVRDPS